ncbi:MAG: hypothetical protein HY778_10445 [Betaproteobacteria bacterium]|nr:hypothetical protein [Betaproteobacteria bacterium]
MTVERIVAEALVMTRCMIAHYRTGSRPIPKAIRLACIGWEAQRARQTRPAKPRRKGCSEAHA